MRSRSVSADAAGRVGGLEFSEIEVAACLQGLGGGGVLQVFGWRLQPRGILALLSGHLGDRVASARGAAAMVVRPTGADRGDAGSSQGEERVSLDLSYVV